jgi:methionyl-tRNA formyltransferase
LRVDWSWPTERVLRRIRALSPVPGLALEIRGVELFVVEASRAESFPSALVAGEANVGTGAVVVRTSDGAVALRRALIVAPESDTPLELDAAALAAHVAAAGDTRKGDKTVVASSTRDDR